MRVKKPQTRANPEQGPVDIALRDAMPDIMSHGGQGQSIRADEAYHERKKVLQMTDVQGVTVPVWEKYMLTIREAADYFGIGEHKLRDLLDKNVEMSLSVWNGNRQLIRRKKLEEFLDECDSI